MVEFCPTVSVGFATLNTAIWLDVDAPVTVTASVPQTFDVSQTVIVALPTPEPYTVIELPDIPAETIPLLEMLDMEYDPLPPEMVTA
jgi:hypothetical protein